MPTREIVPQTRRQRVANYGDDAETSGNCVATLFANDALQGGSILLTIETIEFDIPEGSLGDADYRPFLKLSWGHGGSSVYAEFDLTKRQRIPIVASSLNAQIFIKALVYPGQTAAAAVPAAAFMRVRGFMAEGVDGVQLYPTIWGTQLNVASGVLATKAARLASLRAINPGAFAYLLLFDAAAVPGAGAVPFDVVPLPDAATSALGPVDLSLGQTRAYVHGIAWAMSSTPFALAAVDTPIALSFELES